MEACVSQLVSWYAHSYRKLSLKYHPDKNKTPGADRKFYEIAEAYDVLRDRTLKLLASALQLAV